MTTPRRLVCESLEARAVPASVADLLDDGLLWIDLEENPQVGPPDPGPKHDVTISEYRGDVLVRAGRRAWLFDAEVVNAVAVEGGEAADAVEFASLPKPLPVTLALGGGRDRIDIGAADGTGQVAALNGSTFDLKPGADADTIHINDQGGRDASRITLGEKHIQWNDMTIGIPDAGDVGYTPNPDDDDPWPWWFELNGGAGDDVFVAEHLDPHGLVGFGLNGGLGDDVFDFSRVAFNPQPEPPEWLVAIDGGRGTDTFVGPEEAFGDIVGVEEWARR